MHERLKEHPRIVEMPISVLERADGRMRLVESWREEAALFRRRGQDAMAALAESYAEDFEAWWDEYWCEELDLQQAATESGYPVNTLGRMVREGRIENAGRKNAPRIKRSDVPRKPHVRDDVATSRIEILRNEALDARR